MSINTSSPSGGSREQPEVLAHFLEKQTETAAQIALKLKELTYIVTEPYPSADFCHGPVSVGERGFPVVVWLPN